MLAQVTQDRAEMACDDCGAKVWHFALQVNGTLKWRAVEHVAPCHRPCTNGYTEGPGHQQLGMADLHFRGCGRCSVPKPLPTSVPPGPRERPQATSWWPPRLWRKQ